MSVYEKIVRGLNEAVDYENGKGNAQVTTYTVAPVPDSEPKEICSSPTENGDEN